MTDSQRFARHVALPAIGDRGQQAFADASIAIIGLGGLGCPAALYLANSGIGEIVLNDFDRVDESNLPRQILFGDSDVGRPKADAAADALHRTAPHSAIERLPERLSEAGLVSLAERVDVVLDCTDNFQTRLSINEACTATATPLVVGAAIRLEGQVAVLPTPHTGPCYRCLYSDDDELLGNCAGNGVLTSVTGVIGTLMATEALKLIAVDRLPPAGLTVWDAGNSQWNTLALKRNPVCSSCGS